jgi:hypothetical protein
MHCHRNSVIPIGRLTSHTSDLGAFMLNYLGQTGQITVTVHLIMRSRAARRSCTSIAFRFERLRPTLARLENAPGPPLDAGEKAIVSEWSADTLGGA